MYRLSLFINNISQQCQHVYRSSRNPLVSPVRLGHITYFSYSGDKICKSLLLSSAEVESYM
jgi:hypothetical protein